MILMELPFNFIRTVKTRMFLASLVHLKDWKMNIRFNFNSLVIKVR